MSVLKKRLMKDKIVCVYGGIIVINGFTLYRDNVHTLHLEGSVVEFRDDNHSLMGSILLDDINELDVFY